MNSFAGKCYCLTREWLQEQSGFSLLSRTEESPSCTLHLSSPICWSSKDCAKWIQTRLPSVCSACSFNRAHSHKSQSLTTFWLTFPPFLLRTFWEITWLGSYLEDSGSLHNHMERAICRHVLPLSLLVNRGSPSLVFHQKEIPKAGASTFWPGKGETRTWGTTEMLVFAGRSATFTVSYESGEEERKKKRIQPYNAQHTTFHLEIQTRWKQGKQVPHWICNLSAFLSWFVMSH